MITQYLMGLSIAVTLLSWTLFPGLVPAFTMHSAYLSSGHYFLFVVQTALFQFLHADITHLIFNMAFLYQIGFFLERIMGQKKYLEFFALSTVITAFSLLLFTTGFTLGISNFCMAILSYAYFYSRDTHIFDSNSLLFWLVLNVAIGLTPGISFVGHAVGAFSGWLYYQYRR